MTVRAGRRQNADPGVALDIRDPASVIVGTSGKLRERFLPVTASARNLPSSMCGTAGDSVLKPIGVWPAITEASAGPPPL